MASGQGAIQYRKAWFTGAVLLSQVMARRVKVTAAPGNWHRRQNRSEFLAGCHLVGKCPGFSARSQSVKAMFWLC